jgi:hypothetical protein
VNADGPQGSEKSMGQHHVDGNGEKVAAGEDGDCLNEGIQRVEGETREGRDCLRLVVDEM